MSKTVTVGNMKAETNGKTSFIAIDDIGDLLHGQVARMGLLHQEVIYLPGTSPERNGWMLRLCRTGGPVLLSVYMFAWPVRPGLGSVPWSKLSPGLVPVCMNTVSSS